MNPFFEILFDLALVLLQYSLQIEFVQAELYSNSAQQTSSGIDMFYLIPIHEDMTIR